MERIRAEQIPVPDLYTDGISNEIASTMRILVRRLQRVYCGMDQSGCKAVLSLNIEALHQANRDAAESSLVL